MSALERRLAEDKAVRDGALGVLKADVALLRADLSERGIGGRIADRIGDSTMDMVDEAAEFAEANKGKVAAGLAAIVLWFARGPILDVLADLLGDEERDDDAELESRARDDAEP